MTLNLDYDVSYIIFCILIICRIVTALGFLPGLGEPQIPLRIKLMIGVFLSIICMTIIKVDEMTMQDIMKRPIYYAISEVMIGIILGLAARVMMMAMHIAGSVIALHSGLSSAVLFDPTQGHNDSAISSFFMYFAIVLIFSTNMHIELIRTLCLSYNGVFAFGSFYKHNTAYFELIIYSIYEAFVLGAKIAMPFIVLGIIVNIISGLGAKLMPAVQVFNIMLPAQILMTIWLLYVSLAGVASWFISVYMKVYNA